MFKLFSNKKGVEIQGLIWWIIGICVLVIVLSAYFILKERGVSAIEYLRNVLRFRLK